MGRIRNRKGKRQPVVAEKDIVLMVYDGRINGVVMDASERGLGVLLPEDSGIEEGQKIRILYRRQMQRGKVVRVQPGENGQILVGIKLN